MVPRMFDTGFTVDPYGTYARAVGKRADPLGSRVRKRCLGAALATLEVEIAFATIIERMPNVRLATREVKWVDNIYFRSLQALPVEF